MASAGMHDGSLVDLRIHGSGPTLLMHPQPAWSTLSPALLENKRALDDALVERLSDRYRLVMFEYPGEPRPPTLTPANVVADLLAIADAAGAERFAWCGYSWTAVIGLQFALDNDRLTALVCGGWPPLSGRYDRMLELVVAGRNETMIPFYGALQSFDDAAAQGRITCPRLCFVGSADDEGGARIGPIVAASRERLEALGWDVRILDGLDHVDPLDPDVFVPLVGDWLDGVLAGRLESTSEPRGPAR